METVTSDAVSMTTEELVAPGGAVTADNINLKIGIPERGSQVVEEIEHPGIVLMNLAGAVVVQITVQALQRFLIVTSTIAIDDVQAFSGMRVKKM
jgi:hypothetical protein